MYNYVQHVLTAVTRNKLESLEAAFLLTFGFFRIPTPPYLPTRMQVRIELS